MTDLSKTREALLRKVAEEYGYEFALLLFIDRSKARASLVSSYVHARDQSLTTLLHNQIHHLTCADVADPTDAELDSGARAFIAAMELKKLMPEAHFSYHILATDCSPFDYECAIGDTRTLGLLVMAGPAEATPIPFAELEQLATAIAVGRCNRFISTVLRTQRDLTEASGSLDDTIRRASAIFANELGAGAFRYRNKNKQTSWIEHALTADSTEVLSGGARAAPSQALDGASESNDPTLDLARRPRNGETLEVTLSQPSFRIANLSFRRADRLTDDLTVVRSEAIGISFREKEDPGYLQSRFSETDERIAEAVYNNLQNFAELKLADESYEEVFSILHGKSLTLDGSAKDLLHTLRRLSTLIENVHVLSVGLLENEIDLQCETAEARRPINKTYTERLKEKYLDKFYFGKNLPDYSQLTMGMDANDRHFYIEVHTPREFGDPKVYIISFNEPFVAQATLNSLTNLFSELFTRMRDEDFRLARSNNLTETRHAVFHHFASAINWISVIKSDWDIGLRYRNHWTRMLDDAVFPEGIDWANWSLHQADLILENGRFLIKDIDEKTISRKPMNVDQIIQDCHSALRAEARRKSVKVIIKVSGKPRISATGDEVLLKIAIMNLVDNAIKYTSNRGVVFIEVIYKSEHYEVRVSNRGDPIPEKQFHYLMQIGVRAKQRDHLNLRPGTGLGLPVANRILRAHARTAELKHESIRYSRDLDGPGNAFVFEMPYLTGLASASPSADDRRG